MSLNFYIEPRPHAVQKVGNVPDMPLPMGPPKEHPTGGGGVLLKKKEVLNYVFIPKFYFSNKD